MEEQVTLADLNERAWSLHRREPQAALEVAREARDRGLASGDSVAAAVALRTIGACHYQLGNVDEAVRDLDQALLELNSLSDRGLPEDRDLIHSAAGECQRLLARAAFLARDFEGAFRHITDAIAHFEQAADRQGVARAFNDAGSLHSHLGSFEQGLDYLLASLSVLDDDEAAVPASGSPLNNIGNVYMIQGQPQQALIFFERALEVFRREGSGREQVIALGNVARASEALGDPSRALELHEEAVSLAKSLGDIAYLPATLAKYGAVLGKLGRHEEAFAAFEEALACYREPGASFRDEVLVGLAQLRLETGDPERAEELLREAVELTAAANDRPGSSAAHERLADALEALGFWREALEHYREYHRLDSELKEELFAGRTQVLLLQHELDQSRRESELLRNMNKQLNDAFGELQALHEALEEKSSELERLSLTDPLTKLSNRRHLELRMQEELTRLQRGGGVFSLIMADLDDFKAINDRFTHAMGDEILTEFSRLLRENTRQADVVARIGGEEFVLLLPQASLEDALAVAEKLRSAVERHDWERLQRGLVVTMSAGVSEARTGDSGAAALRDADRGLYRAKHQGKNMVCWEYDRVNDPG